MHTRAWLDSIVATVLLVLQSTGTEFCSHQLHCQVQPQASRSRTPASVTKQDNLLLLLL